MVLLPLPLSPTRARILPRRSEKLTSSTACKSRGSPPRPKGLPPPMGKYLVRPRTSSTVSDGCCIDWPFALVQVTGDPMSRCHFEQRRLDLPMERPHLGTA